MTFSELRKKEGRVSGLVALERAIPRRIRARAKSFLLLVAPLALMAIVFFEEETKGWGIISLSQDTLYGIILLSIASWLVIFMLDSFYYAHYFSGSRFSLPEWGIGRRDFAIPYEILEIVSHTHSGDLTAGFLESFAGRDILARLDISEKKAEEFILKNRNRVFADSIVFAEPVTLPVYAAKVFDADKGFAEFLHAFGVNREDVVATAAWVASIYERRKETHRWWGRDSLGRIKGVGKEWSQGDTFLLEKYGAFVQPENNSILFKKEIDELEQVLARTTGADALLVADVSSEFKAVLAGLAGRIADGSVLPQLEHKKLLVLNEVLLDEQTGEQQDGGQKGGSAETFEILLTKILNEAVNAGHIVLVIPNLPLLVETAKKHGVDIVELLNPFLTSSELQIIAFSLKDSYNTSLSHHTELMSRFERIFIENEEAAVIVRALEHKVYDIERMTHLFFTYQSLASITESAERYFSSELVQDKALDIFDELVPRLIQKRQKGARIVRAEDVQELITLKTGIPTGSATVPERDKLLHLESILHERVVAQDSAVQAIAKAMRRSRAGLSDSKRPLGSFLFLGSTGVGKTETAKTLARVFFESEENMLRFDMSEFSSSDASVRLAGFLAEKIRENPYCVLLLDEFEKADQKVHDLFLQIIDEGQFADIQGKKANARNLILIATSNAGSDLIWDLSQVGKDPSEHQSEIISHIVREHTLKPELINRFDGVIIFHPLGDEHREKVARILLEELQGRLSGQGLTLTITPELTAFVAQQAQEKSFGARPLRRVIQEKIEESIARRLLDGTLKKGDTVTLTVDDLKNS